eukprot:GHVH01016297.1.p1 GENE.GHVH01016297.1~~GHVH01016297.1.p1  ORF type:complete len:791 (-),score=122.26 GHVH01016297.1:114-2486(-)
MKIVNLPVERHDEKRIIYSIIGVQASLSCAAEKWFPDEYSKFAYFHPDSKHWSLVNHIYDISKKCSQPWRRYLANIKNHKNAVMNRTNKDFFSGASCTAEKLHAAWLLNVIKFQGAVQFMIYQAMHYCINVQKNMIQLAVEDRSRIEEKYSDFLEKRLKAMPDEMSVVWNGYYPNGDKTKEKIYFIDRRPILSTLEIIPQKLDADVFKKLSSFGEELQGEFDKCQTSIRHTNKKCDCYLQEFLMQRIRETLAGHFLMCMKSFVLQNEINKSMSRFDLIFMLGKFNIFYNGVIKLNTQAEENRPQNNKSWQMTAQNALTGLEKGINQLYENGRHQPSDLTTHKDAIGYMLKTLDNSDIEGGKDISKLLGRLFEMIRSKKGHPVLTNNISECEVELMKQIFMKSSDVIAQVSSSEVPAKEELQSFVYDWMMWCSSRVYRRTDYLTTHRQKIVELLKALEDSDIEGGKDISQLLRKLFKKMRLSVKQFDAGKISEDALELIVEIYQKAKETLKAEVPAEVPQDSSSEDPDKANLISFVSAWMKLCQSIVHQRSKYLTTHREEIDKSLKALENSDIEGGKDISKLLELLFDMIRMGQIDPVYTDNISEHARKLMLEIFKKSKKTLNAIRQDSSFEDPKKAEARADVISFVYDWMMWCSTRVHPRSNHLTTHGEKKVDFHTISQRRLYRRPPGKFKDMFGFRPPDDEDESAAEESADDEDESAAEESADDEDDEWVLDEVLMMEDMINVQRRLSNDKEDIHEQSPDDKKKKKAAEERAPEDESMSYELYDIIECF